MKYASHINTVYNIIYSVHFYFLIIISSQKYVAKIIDILKSFFKAHKLISFKRYIYILITLILVANY